MTDPLGVAEVQVTANVDPALESIGKVMDALTALGNKADEVVKLNSGGNANTTEKKTSSTEAGIISRAAGNAALTPTLANEQFKGEIELTVDADSITEQVRGAVEGETFTIKVQLDTSQITKQLREGMFPIGVVASQPGSGGATGSLVPAPTGKAPTAAMRVVNNAGGESGIDREFLQTAARLASATSGQQISVPQGDLRSSDVVSLLTQAGTAMGAKPGQGFNTSEHQFYAKGTGRASSAAVERIAEGAAGGMDKGDARIEAQEIAPIIHKVMRAVTPKYAASGGSAPAPIQQAVAQAVAPVAAIAQENTAAVESAREATTAATTQSEDTARTRALEPERGLKPEQVFGLFDAMPARSGTTRGDSRSGGTSARQGQIRDRDPQIGGQPNNRTGRMSIDDIDVTDLAELAGAGVFHGWQESTETGELIGRIRDPETGNYLKTPSRAITSLDAAGDPIGTRTHAVRNVGPTEMLRRTLQTRLGREVTSDEMKAYTKPGAEGDTAPVAGDATGYFAPALRRGQRASHDQGPLQEGRQGFIRGQMDAEQAAAIDWLRDTGGSGVPMGAGVRQRPEEFMTQEQSADYRASRSRSNAESRHRVLRDQLRVGDTGAGLTVEQLMRNTGQRAGIERMGEVHPESMGELAGLFEAILDPSLLPTKAEEDVGPFNEGDPLDKYGGMTYRLNQIMEATGLMPALGIENTPVTFTGVKKALQGKSAQGGLLPHAMLQAIQAKHFGDVERGQEAVAQQEATQNAAITRDAKAAVLERAPTLGFETRRGTMEAALDELTGSGGRYASAAIEGEAGNENSLAERTRAQARGARNSDVLGREAWESAMGLEGYGNASYESKAYKARSKAGVDDPGERFTNQEFEGLSQKDRQKVLARRDQELQEYFEGENAPEFARATELSEGIEQERQVGRVAGSIVDALAEAGDDTIYDLPTLLQQQSGAADPAGEALGEGVLDKAVGDIVQAQHARLKGGGTVSRPASRTMGKSFMSPVQFQALQRGATTTTDKGGQMSYIDAEGNVVGRERGGRTTATRMDETPPGAPGTGESLLFTGTQNQEAFAGATGNMPNFVDHIMEQSQGQHMASALEMAETVTPNAGAMVVTIGGPIPLPVNVVNASGAASVGGGMPVDGGRKPPPVDGGGGEREADAAGKAAGPPPPAPRKDTIFVSPGGRLGRTPGSDETYDQRLGASSSFVPGEGGRVGRKGQGEVNIPGVRLPALERVPELTAQEIAIEQQALLPAQASNARSRGVQPLATRGNIQRPVAAFGQESGVVLEQKDRDLRRDTEAKERNAAEKTQAREAAAAAKQEAAEGKLRGIRTPGTSQLNELLKGYGQPLGLPPTGGKDFEALSGEQGFLEAQQSARGALASTRRKIPSRALGPSVVNFFESKFGGADKVFQQIAAVEQEFGQLGQIGRARGQAQGRVASLRTQREAVIAARADARDDSKPFAEQSDDYKRLSASLLDFNKKIISSTDAKDKLIKLEKAQAEKVTRESKTAVGNLQIGRLFAAGFAGGVGASFVTKAVGVATQVMSDAFTKVVLPQIDLLTGSNMVTQRYTEQLAKVIEQSNFSDTAARRTLVQGGFETSGVEGFGPVIAQSRARAGANQAQRRIEAYHAQTNIANQQAQLGYPEDLAPAMSRNPNANFQFDANLIPGMPIFQAFTGRDIDAVNVGGQDSVEQMAARVLEENVNFEADKTRNKWDIFNGFDYLTSTSDLLQRDNPEAVEARRLLESRVNVPLQEAGLEGVRAEPGEVDNNLLAMLNERGYTNFKNALRDQGVTITGIETDDFDTLDEVIKSLGAENLSYEAEATNAAGSVEFQNQLGGFVQSRMRSMQAMQMGFAMQGVGNPVTEMGTGLVGGGSRRYQRQTAEVIAATSVAEQQGRDMVEALMPDGMFQEYEKLGKSIKRMGEEAGGIQVDQQMRSYTMSLKQAQFAVADLTALTESGQGSVIGGLERENMLMQRRLQILQFEQQQRSINFGVAVAGFQAAGLTGEERSARIDIAKREAAIKQEQLGLQKGIFGNQVQIVDQTNIRQLEMATLNLQNVVASFRENNRLKEIADTTNRIRRRQGQLEGIYSQNLATEMQLADMRDKFRIDMGNTTQTLVDWVDKYDDGGKAFDSAIDNVGAQIGKLEDMLDGKEGIPGLTVRDVTISPKITGTVVDYKELVDLIVVELGKMGVRIGMSGGR